MLATLAWLRQQGEQNCVYQLCAISFVIIYDDIKVIMCELIIYDHVQYDEKCGLKNEFDQN